MTEKGIGYLLLVIGIGIIGLSALSVYLVFTKQVTPAQLFTLGPISIDVGKILAGSLPKELQASVPSSQQEILSSEMVNQPMNLFAHTILMGFMASVGLKLAEIGGVLLRPIVVKVKESKDTSS